MTLDYMKQQEEMRRRFFEDHLRNFVREWAPENDRDRYAMQTQLMLLMRDAMQSQGAVYSLGVEGYAARALEVRSLSPLNAIFTPEEKK